MIHHSSARRIFDIQPIVCILLFTIVVWPNSEITAQRLSEIDSLLNTPEKNYLELEGYGSETFRILFVKLIGKYGYEQVCDQAIAMLRDPEVSIDYKLLISYEFPGILSGIQEEHHQYLQAIHAALQCGYMTYAPECKSYVFLLVQAIILGSQKEYVKVKSIFDTLKGFLNTQQCPEELMLYHMEISNELYQPLNNNVKALEHNMKSLHILDSLKSIEVKIPQPIIFKMYGEMANFHYKTENWKLAIGYWRKSLKLLNDDHTPYKKMTGLFNNIGLCYKKIQQYDSAIIYFNKCIELAESNNNDALIGIGKGNLGTLMLIKGQYKEALKLFKEDTKRSHRNNEHGSVINALKSLGWTYFQVHHYDSSRIFYDSALNYYHSVRRKETLSSFQSLSNLHHRYAELELATGDYQNALKHEKAASIQDDSVIQLLKREKSSIVHSYHNFEKQYAKLKLANAQIKNHELKELIFLILALMTGLFILFVILFNRMRLKKIKAEVKMTESAKKVEIEKARRIEEEMTARINISRLESEHTKGKIALKERQLSAISLQIQEKNEVMSSLKSQLEKIAEKKPSLQKEFKKLHRHIKSSMNVQSDWEHYKLHFEQVHPDFFSKLTKSFPELSLGDLRICAYIRMNIDNNSMSKILNVSTDSLRVRRHRLRKKMNVDSDKELYGFLSSLDD